MQGQYPGFRVYAMKQELCERGLYTNTITLILQGGLQTAHIDVAQI